MLRISCIFSLTTNQKKEIFEQAEKEKILCLKDFSKLKEDFEGSNKAQRDELQSIASTLSEIHLDNDRYIQQVGCQYSSCDS